MDALYHTVADYGRQNICLCVLLSEITFTIITVKGCENNMLQITIQHDEPLQITDEFKNQISESVANYILTHWDEAVNIENIDNNYIVSINT